MATTISLPQPGTIYPDVIDERNFNFLKQHIGSIEAGNDNDILERISAGSIKKLFTESGLYVEGVPVEYINIVIESVAELAQDDQKLDCMFWLIQQSTYRVYLQPRHRISSGNKHIGNIWIFNEKECFGLFMVKAH
jgi:hypothetical protein